MTSVPIYKPTWEEFKDVNVYISYLESIEAYHNGAVKIIPPPEWKPRSISYDDIKGWIIKEPLYLAATGDRGIFQVTSACHKPINVEQFEVLCNSERFKTPTYVDYDDLDRQFWQTLNTSVPIYGADVEYSWFDDGCSVWNMNKLGSILDYVHEDYGLTLPGITSSYMYFGMWKSSFSWHTEDMDLYSMNYIHYGAPKTWLTIPLKYGRRFEDLSSSLFPSSHRVCANFLRHKTTLIGPDILRLHGIPFNRTTQNENEIMIIFPNGYHAGYNNGYNVAEAVNFASPMWIEYGKRAKKCFCGTSVHLSMDTFVQRFQPERYSLWLNADDYGFHPTTGEFLQAQIPTVQDILINKHNKKVPQSVLESLRFKNGLHCRFKPPPKLTFAQNYPDIGIKEIKNRADIPQEMKEQF